MATDTVTKEETLEGTSASTASEASTEDTGASKSTEESGQVESKVSEDEVKLESSQEESSVDNSSDESTSSDSTNYQELIDNINKKLEESIKDLHQCQDKNIANITLTDVKQTKKRNCLLGDDHDNLNFLFEYVVYLNRRKKELSKGN